jgi:hypothetical protein
MTPQPNLKWYSEISAGKNLSPRCPFASVHRCPRYYQSVSLLGEAGVATAIEPEEDRRLLDLWKRTDLWPVVDEQHAAVWGRHSNSSNFCPEVSFERYGWFASHLAYYPDEQDMDVAHRNLAEEGAPGSDWRWNWAQIVPMHYADCPLYSQLLLGVKDVRRKSQIGFVT